jgi:hypothetical protein
MPSAKHAEFNVVIDGNLVIRVIIAIDDELTGA